MKKSLLKNLSIENQLRNAIKNKEFHLVFQPIFNLKQKKIYGVEALLRWKNKKLGNVKPSQFIPIAEKADLMSPIDRWVIHTAFSQFFTWKKKYPKLFKNFMLNINISASQLHNPNFKKWLISLRKKYGALYKNIVFEITETTLIRDIHGASRVMEKIHELSINFAIDDFGAGYTSLYYLKKLPIAFLKIDQKFLHELPLTQHSIQIIDTIVKLGKSLDVIVIAEGVSQQKQAKLLQQKQCPYAQGYYFSMPISTDQLEKLYF